MLLNCGEKKPTICFGVRMPPFTSSEVLMKKKTWLCDVIEI
jgi:hypothetical protein